MLGEFDLDPCGCPLSPYRLAKVTYLPPDQDGLTLPWEGRVFCNPPYGPHVGEWAKRMAEHRNGILLIFRRTETEVWRGIWKAGDAFLFPYGRINFLRADGERANSGTAPSALIAYGQNNVEALQNSGIAGALQSRAELLGGIKASVL